MCEREKRASALIKIISAFGIIHAAEATVTLKPGKKVILGLLLQFTLLPMVTQEPLILHLIIFCCDWQMKDLA